MQSLEAYPRYKDLHRVSPTHAKQCDSDRGQNRYLCGVVSEVVGIHQLTYWAKRPPIHLVTNEASGLDHMLRQPFGHHGSPQFSVKKWGSRFLGNVGVLD